MTQEPFPDLISLSTPVHLCLAALVLGQMLRIPISPNKEMTRTLLEALSDVALIRLPRRGSRRDVELGMLQTPVEKLRWRSHIEVAHFEQLLTNLRILLREAPQDDHGNSMRVELWKWLSHEEAIFFFEGQLLKHQFDVAWAQELHFAQQYFPQTLSIANWRYCCWAATRHGASVAQQQRTPDADFVRDAITVELCRRSKYLAEGHWTNGGSFPPTSAEPRNAMSKLFTNELAPMGMEFWTVPASLDGLSVASCAA